jgi:hypothetical protein
MAIPHEDFYKEANLTENPFRSNPALERDPRMGIWVGYSAEQLKLIKFLRRSLADEIGNQNLILIYGQYGTGKSHALLWSHYYVCEKMKSEFQSMAFYVSTLKKSKGVMTFLGAFQEDIVARSNIVKDILSFKQFLEERIVEYKKSKGLQEGTFVSLLPALLKSTDLINVAREILECDGEDDVRDLLDPKNDFEAQVLFARLTNLFVYEFELQSGKARFKKGVYLFIDEMDRLSFSSLKEAREVNDWITHLYDACSECFGIVLAATASDAELSVLFSPMVLERLGNKKIELPFMQPVDAKIFVKDILNTARINAKKNVDYFPFAEDAIEAAMAGLVQITPRKIMDRMQQMLEEVRLVDISPAQGIITAQILDAHNIWENVS